MTDLLDQENLIAHAILTDLPTKENISKAQNHLMTLDWEVNCLARQVKIWMLIASRSKDKTMSPDCDDFFGWAQYNSIKQFAIDGLKIADDSREWAISAIEFLDIEKAKTTALIKNSGIQDRLKQLQEIVFPLRDWRNKRYAHLDPEEIANVSCDLQRLYDALAGLKSSLGYIQHFITNPHYILTEKWGMYINNTDSSHHRATLDNYFQTDPTIKSLENVLDVCSKQTSTILRDAKLFAGKFQNKVT